MSELNFDNVQLKLGKYEHYKGAVVEVLWVAKHSETLEPLVVYKKLNWDLRVRPQKMFMENVIVNGVEVNRFRFIW